MKLPTKRLNQKNKVVGKAESFFSMYLLFHPASVLLTSFCSFLRERDGLASIHTGPGGGGGGCMEQRSDGGKKHFLFPSYLTYYGEKNVLFSLSLRVFLFLKSRGGPCIQTLYVRQKREGRDEGIFYYPHGSESTLFCCNRGKLIGFFFYQGE